MPNVRVGSLTLVTNTLRDVSGIQERLGTLQSQISSGFRSDTYSGITGSVEQFSQVSSQLSRATQYTVNNQVNISRLQTADAALNEVYNITDKIKNAIVGANGATIGTGNLPQVITDLLVAFGGELNATYNGAYIFAGSDTSRPPVPRTDVDNNTLGVPDDNYYVGSKQDVILRADEGTDIAFPVRADDIAFQKIYSASRLALKAAKDKSATLLSEAQQLIQDGLTDLNTARARVGNTVNNIETVNDRLNALRTYWTELTDNISKTDIVAASTEVSGYQAVLQASFQIYARLSQLRLSDYL